MYRVTCLFSCVLLALATAVQAAEKSDNFLDRAEVRQFIKAVATEHQLDPQRLEAHFAGLSSQQGILDAISTPAERTLTWGEYRGIFLKTKRIEQGRDFLGQHRALLERAEAEYGVPITIITAIIGVETFYGRITGKHKVIEALATLAFDFPRRSKFFTSELEEFLVLVEKEGWNPAEIKGSYAGAMGYPQFISSSYRQYAVDFDGDGQRDLHNSIADVIGSVANYLAVHGWRKGAPVASLWQTQAGEDVGDQASIKALVRKSLKPQIALATVKNLGFKPALPPIYEQAEKKERFVSTMLLEGTRRHRRFIALTLLELWSIYAFFACAIGFVDVVDVSVTWCLCG